MSAKDDEIHREILEKYKDWTDAWRKIYDAAKADFWFASGRQWEDSRKGGLKLTYNLTGGAVRYVVNQSKGNPPAIKVSPLSGGKKNTAKVLDGLIRRIENRSHAQNAYSEALRHAVTGGIGFVRVVVAEDQEGFPELRIRHVKDFTTIIPDPRFREADASDISGFFAVDRMSKEAFKRKFPKAITERTSFEGIGQDWIDDDSVQFAEYWCRENGEICQYIISGREILERRPWLGQVFPLGVMLGEDHQLGNDREIKGIVRDIRDVQKVINYAKTASTEYLGRSGRGEWVGVVENFQGLEKFWDGKSEYPYKMYRTGPNGERPTREDPLQPPAALLEGADQAAADLRMITGIRDPNKDIPAGQSGKAIALQQSQSDVAIYGFIESRDLTISHIGRVILDMIPHVYNYPHIMEITGIDGQLQSVPINQPYEENGEDAFHDITEQAYTCNVSSGPSYLTKQQQTLDGLVELSKYVPNIAQVGSDIIAQQFDFDQADELAARLKATIPPNILAASSASNADGSGAQNQAVALQAQLQQAQGVIQQLQAQLQQATNANAQKMALQNDQQAHEIQMKQLDSSDKQRLQQMEAQLAILLQNMKSHSALVAEDIKAQNQMDAHDHATAAGIISAAASRHHTQQGLI